MPNRIIRVTVGTNLDRAVMNYPSDTTVRKILEDNQINYSTTTIFFDGNTVKAGEMDKTLADFNVADNCYIIAAQKTENA